MSISDEHFDKEIKNLFNEALVKSKNDAKGFARHMRGMFLAYMEVGFDEEQAFTLVSIVIEAIMREAVGGGS